jgi:AraC-like DNA-binding protein
VLVIQIGDRWMRNFDADTAIGLVTGRVKLSSVDLKVAAEWMQRPHSESVKTRLVSYLLRAHLLRTRSDATSTLRSLISIKEKIYAELNGELVAVYEELVAYEYLRCAKPVQAVLSGFRALRTAEIGDAVELRVQRSIAAAEMQIGEALSAIGRLEHTCIPLAEATEDANELDAVLIQCATARWVAATSNDAIHRNYWNSWPIANGVQRESAAEHCRHATLLLGRLSPLDSRYDAYYFHGSCQALLMATCGTLKEAGLLIQQLLRERVHAKDALTAKLKIEAAAIARWTFDWATADRLIKEVENQLDQSQETQLLLAQKYEQMERARATKNWQIADQIAATIARARLGSISGLSELFVVERGDVITPKSALPKTANDLVTALSNKDLFTDSLERILDRIGISRRTAELHLRRELGQTPAEYRLQQKMLHARHLLVETSLGVSAISERVGFSTTGAFSAAYRRIHGVSPTDDRTRRESAS